MVSSVQCQAPKLTEPQLDGILLNQLLNQPVQVNVESGWACQIVCELIGGKIQFEDHEIGDILFVISLHRSGQFQKGKLVYCQSKALKPDYNRKRKQYEFKKTSRYSELKTKDSRKETQYERIERYEKSSNSIPVYYLLYNPSSVPLNSNRQSFVPRKCVAGVRVLSTKTVRESIASAGNPLTPSFEILKPLNQYRLEEFIVELVKCGQVKPIKSKTAFFDKLDSAVRESGASYILRINLNSSDDVIEEDSN